VLPYNGELLEEGPIRGPVDLSAGRWAGGCQPGGVARLESVPSGLQLTFPLSVSARSSVPPQEMG
jgi:hypothetical protein